MIDQGRNSLNVRILRGTLLFLMRFLFRIEHYGIENIPCDGPLIIVANHETYFDPFWVAVRVHRAVRFMAWDKIFRLPFASGIFHWLGAFPVSLESPESSAYKTALKILHRGEALMIFPEGGRSPNGRLMPFKQGAAHLALRTGATILPVVIRGGGRVWSSRMLLPRPGKVRIEYLEPVTKERFERTPQALIEKVREQIERRL